MLFNKYFAKYYLKYWICFLIGIIALVAVDFFQLEIPDVVGEVIDGLRYKTLTKDVLFSLSKKMFFVAFMVFIGRFIWRICIFGNAVKIEADIRNDMFNHMIKLSQEKFSKNKTGAIMALYTNDLNSIRQIFGMGTMMSVDALALGILAFYKMLKLNVTLALASLVPLLIVLVISNIVGRIIRRKSLLNLKAYSELSDFVQEDYMGIGVIKAFVKEKLKLKQFEKYNQKNMDTCIAFTKDNIFVNVLISAILTTIASLIILIGGYYIYKDATNTSTTFTIGELTKFSSYFGSLVWPIMAIGQLINLSSQGQASAKRILDLLNEEVEINDLAADSSISEIKGDITFNHLSFSYPGSDKTVLDDVTFKINSGEFVGLMGSTGSGKTTLVDLLVRMYNVNENTILIDDNDIMTIPLSLLRDSIAYVTQESFLFKNTISSNICFSMEKDDEDVAKKYAILSDVDKDIEEFSEGYNTYVGERGVTVSGGQKQRISIARALLKEAPILVLDDSLSAVDIITEEAILKRLRAIRSGKTTILIAHRISTLKKLDKIVVLNDGKVDGIGTHETLLETNEIYKREVKLQELEKEAGEYDYDKN